MTSSIVSTGEGPLDMFGGQREPTLWGAGPTELHDRLWAGRGVQVVRPGGQAPSRHGPRLFLLLGPRQMVDFPLRPVTRRMAWLKPRAVRLRVRDARPAPYRERVIRAPDGAFAAVRREYGAASKLTSRCWLTPEAALARRWNSQPDAPTAKQALLAGLDRRERVPIEQTGRILDPAQHEDVEEWLCAAAAEHPEIGSAFEGIYTYQDGVWVHETARLGERVRFVGPCLVGADVELPPGATVIGPIVLGDAAPVPLQPIQWDLVGLPYWRLLPRAGARRLRSASKRLFDIVFSAVVLAASLPLFPLVMLLIYAEDRRPFFFAHRRQTIMGREFPCYKFRTMYRDAERLKAVLQAQNVCDGPQFFIKDDPRVLRIGRLLRRTHLDELPQFWNVLLGHMSVVGPRPSPDSENQYCPAWREARLSIRPGVTGLWQVKRSRQPETDFQEWIRYDLEYAQHQSWRLDIWIIFQTFRTIVHR
jgi:lipopolysaccharide/colanic/teichoic acid biosynthesis glycosyltransferase